MAYTLEDSYETDESALKTINSSTMYRAMVFTTTGAYTATKVEFVLGKYIGDVLGTIEIELQGVSGSSPDGNILTSGTIDNADISTTEDWVECVFSSGYALSSGTQYAIVIHGDDLDIYNVLKCYGEDGSGYSGGGRDYSTDSGSTWLGYNEGQDLSFRIYSGAEDNTVEWGGSIAGLSDLSMVLDVTEFITIGGSIAGLSGLDASFDVYELVQLAGSITGVSALTGAIDVELTGTDTGSVSSEFSASIAHPQIKTAELYRITLRSGLTLYYTSHQRNILWNNQVYTAMPITRDQIQVNLSGEIDEAKVYLAAMSGDLAELLSAHILDNAEIEIVAIMRGSVFGLGQERPIFRGLANIEYNRQYMIITLRSWLGSMNITVPRRTVQVPCNWSIFESYCGLIQSSFAYSGAATDGTDRALEDTVRGSVYTATFTGSTSHTIKKGDSVYGHTGGGVAVVVNIIYQSTGAGQIWYCELTGTQFVSGETIETTATGASVALTGTPGEHNTLYRLGELVINTGDNAGERRMILADEDSTLTPTHPFAYTIEADVSYTIYPGCDGRASEVCHSWYGNDDSYGGYLYLPNVEDIML